MKKFITVEVSPYSVEDCVIGPGVNVIVLANVLYKEYHCPSRNIVFHRTYRGDSITQRLINDIKVSFPSILSKVHRSCDLMVPKYCFDQCMVHLDIRNQVERAFINHKNEKDWLLQNRR